MSLILCLQISPKNRYDGGKAMNKHHPVKVRRARQQKTGGYIVIIVLLLTAVLLMLGLSLATRTTEEVYQSGQEADTTRVFNAAETGIEKALYDIQLDPTAVSDRDNYTSNTGELGLSESNATVDVVGEQIDTFNINIEQGEVLTLKWKPNTKINWTYNVTNCSDAAAIIVTLYNTTGPTASHVAYNPYNLSACEKGTNFTEADRYTVGSADVGSRVVLTSATFGLNDTGIGPNSIIRIRPLYAGAAFTIQDSAAIKITSTASDASGGTSAETRKIQVIRTEPAPPSVFDYAVFSGGSLTK